MTVGDLVKVLGFPGVDDYTLGVIVAIVDEPRATGNDVFKVVCTDGDVLDEVWDYDLIKVEA